MTTLHLKSLCCGAKLIGYGRRRRQCVNCGKTYTIYPRKRGRKKKQNSKELLKRVVLENQSLSSQLIHYPGLSLRSLQQRVHNLVRSTASKIVNYPKFQGKYILIGDGVWYEFCKEDWVLYLFILKPRRKNYGYLLDPVILPGKESFHNWKVAIETIPKNVRERTIAFVSDNFRASDKIANHFGFIHQLCHFHLIAEIQKRRGKYKYRIFGKSIREDIYQCITSLLLEAQPEKISYLINQLEALHKHPECPRKLGMLTREFLKNLKKYHAYLKYPQYTIPRTTSALESLGNQISKRTKTLPNPQSVQEWSTAYIRLKKIMKCNGQKSIKNQQN